MAATDIMKSTQIMADEPKQPAMESKNETTQDGDEKRERIGSNSSTSSLEDPPPPLEIKHTLCWKRRLPEAFGNRITSEYLKVNH